MHRNTGGVLAAMTMGDRSGLSAQLRSAYRGAGLSHVLVVSGMHVSILCGDILSTLLPYEWEQELPQAQTPGGIPKKPPAR